MELTKVDKKRIYGGRTMDCKSLMIGDWVAMDFNYPPAHKSPRKICLDDMMRIWQGADCEPIPLTAEILEKNGMRHTRYIDDNEVMSDFDFMSRLASGGHIHVWKNPHGRDCFHIEVLILKTMWNTSRAFHYVHELQQALRIGGLTDLADNFKI